MGICVSRKKKIVALETLASQPTSQEKRQLEEQLRGQTTTLLRQASKEDREQISRIFDSTSDVKTYQIDDQGKLSETPCDKINIEWSEQIQFKQSLQSNLLQRKGTFLINPQQIVFGGAPAGKMQEGYDDKVTTCNDANLGETFLSNQGIGYICKKGFKPDSPNQDDFSILINGGLKILGVFDGHGTNGHDVSNFVHTFIPKHLSSLEAIRTEDVERSFEMAHMALSLHCDSEQTQFDCILSGTTATVAVLNDDKKMLLAHVGDSRAVIARQTTQGLRAFALTKDHKLGDPKEKLRVEKAGGQIRKERWDQHARIYVPGREFPGLNMARSIGDLLANTLGVSQTPDVKEYLIQPEDLFLVIASDGVWEFLSNKEVVDEIFEFGRQGLQSGVESVGEKAWSRWRRRGNMVDDITAVVYYFH